MKKFFSILIIVQACIFISAQKKSIPIKTITKEDGLPTNQVLCVYEDQIGFIWIGNEYGLYRYDGYEFEVFQNDPANNNSIGVTNIRCILEEKGTGNLWIGGSGIDYYDRYTNTFHSDLFPQIKGGISDLFYDHKNNLWIATYDGLYRYNSNNTLSVYRHDSLNVNSLNYNSVFAVNEDKDHNIWIGTAWSSGTGDLQKYNYETNNITRHTATPELRDVYTIYPTSNGDLWVGSYTTGLFRMKKGGFDEKMEAYNTENGVLINNCAENIVADEYGNLYVSNGNGGLVYYDVNKMKSYWYTPDIYNPNSISSKAITSLFKSSNGIIWIGTYNSGINYIDNKSKHFEHYKINFREDGLFNNNIRAFFEDMEGNIWIGTKDNGGISKFNRSKGTFTHFIPEENNPTSLRDDFILSINELNKDELIIGTLSYGFDIFNKRTGKFKHYNDKKKWANSLQNNKILSSYLDDFGILWLASYTLGSFDTKSEKFTEFHLLKEPVCFFPESKEKVWIGTKSNGIFLFDVLTHKIKDYQEATGDTTPAAQTGVSSIQKDSKGRLLIAYLQGYVYRIDSNSGVFDRFIIKDGLFHENIFSLLVDDHDNYWIATSSGLIKYNPETSEYWTFDKNDGLQGNEFERYVALKTSKGEMMFGGRNGFNIFHPDSITLNTSPPPVVITGLKLFNKPVTVNSSDSILSKNIIFCKEITLKHWQSVVTFTFSALNYSSPEKNKYAYMLENFETDWNYSEYQRNATYTSLPAGEYIFRVKASNNDRVWNNEGASLKITILPPWWETWWFRLSLVSLIILTIIIIVRRRTIVLQQQKQKLQKLVNERTNELKEMNQMLSERKEELEVQMHDMEEMNKEIEEMAMKLHEADQTKLRFFANISHEFRTPLALILGPLEKCLRIPDLNNEVITTYHKLMYRNAKRLLLFINQIIDFRKLDQGKKALNLTNQNIPEFIDEVVQAFSVMAESKNIQIGVVSEELRIKNKERRVKNEEFGVKNEEQTTNGLDLSFMTHGSSLITQFWFDADVMGKILYNLISNAIKYTPEGGEIIITIGVVESRLIETLQNQLAIIISDTGIGIKPENIDKIFDRFYRVESDESFKKEGTGIGLSYTKELVELHKGTISVESTPGRGSCFTLQFPLGPIQNNNLQESHISYSANSQDIGKNDNYALDEKKTFDKNSFNLDYIQSMIEDETTKESFSINYLSNINNKSEPEKDFRTSKILIVEDNTDLRNFIISEINEQYLVFDAENGKKAWDMVFEDIPDLIVSDIMMPLMDGIELCEKIKTDENTSHIPVILLTAKGGEENIIQGLETGADDYITKPFNTSILKMKIKNILDTRRRLQEKFQKSIDISPSDISHTNIDEKFITKAIEVINENIENPEFDNNAFISYMNYSRAGVYTKIKTLTGQSLSEFIRTIRLKNAAKLLIEGKYNISEVCVKIGYKHMSTFSTHFSKMFGKPPTQFIKDNLKK